MNIEELKRLAEASIKAGKTGTYKEFAIARTAFGSVANPASVLDLISEVERVTKQRDELMAALKDARDSIAGWGAYALCIFRKSTGLLKSCMTLTSSSPRRRAESWKSPLSFRLFAWLFLSFWLLLF